MELIDVRCKFCGAPLDAEEIKTGIVKCNNCDHVFFTVQKPPKSPEVKSALTFAEIELSSCDFEKAYSAFKRAAELDGEEPEAYFGMALAEHKVRFIHDTYNNRLQPIQYAASDKQFTKNANYRRAVELAAGEQREMYERTGAEIDQIATSFAKLRAEGVDYDIFICAKVTDNDTGAKTRDYARALELYCHLKDHGYKPFYSEREIKNRTGSDYEAYILYALYVSECMVIVCEDESYLTKDWVKYEYTCFGEMIANQEKETDGITIAYSGKVIEKLPGKKGKIQGVDLNRPDAYSIIEDYIKKHQSVLSLAPELSRKQYGEASYRKKQTIKQQINKRTLDNVASGPVSATDSVLIENAFDFLKIQKYALAESYAQKVLSSDPHNSKAYFILFLVKNECQAADELRAKNGAVSDYPLLESAIAASSGSERAGYYDLIYARAYAFKRIEDYREYIELPDSPADRVALLTEDIIKTATESGNAELFDEAIKTVTSADRYVRYNLEFAHKTEDIKYYRNILAADEGHFEALWTVFIADRGLSDIKLLPYLADPANRADAEKTLYSYGYNTYASDKIISAGFSSLDGKGKGADISEECAAIDFVLSMIPQKQNALFSELCGRALKACMKNDYIDQAKKYCEMLIKADPNDHEAHFNKCVLSHGSCNPLMLAAVNITEDPDYLAAISAFTAKKPRAENPYIKRINDIELIKPFTADKECFEEALKNVRITPEKLGNEAKGLVGQFYRQTARQSFARGLERCCCKSGAEVMKLEKDVSDYPEWATAAKFVMVYFACTKDNSVDDLLREVSAIVADQAKTSAKNIEERLKREREKAEFEQKQKKARVAGNITLPVVFVFAIVSACAAFLAPLMPLWGVIVLSAGCAIAAALVLNLITFKLNFRPIGSTGYKLVVLLAAAGQIIAMVYAAFASDGVAAGYRVPAAIYAIGAGIITALIAIYEAFCDIPSDDVFFTFLLFLAMSALYLLFIQFMRLAYPGGYDGVWQGICCVLIGFACFIAAVFAGYGLNFFAGSYGSAGGIFEKLLLGLYVLLLVASSAAVIVTKFEGIEWALLACGCGLAVSVGGYMITNTIDDLPDEVWLGIKIACALCCSASMLYVASTTHWGTGGDIGDKTPAVIVSLASAFALGGGFWYLAVEEMNIFDDGLSSFIMPALAGIGWCLYNMAISAISTSSASAIMFVIMLVGLVIPAVVDVGGFLLFREFVDQNI